MRNELKPDIDTAIKLYSKVKALFDKYVVYSREGNGIIPFDYNEFKSKLTEITGVDYTKRNFERFLEGNMQLDATCWTLSILKLKTVNKITRKELIEIIKRLKDPFNPLRIIQFLNIKITDLFSPKKLMQKWHLYSGGSITYCIVYYYYYYGLLKDNFKNFKFEYFKHSDKNDKAFQLSIDEIVEKLWEEKY